MKRFTKDSYCNVEGWHPSLIEKAAKMMAKDLNARTSNSLDVLASIDNKKYLYKLWVSDIVVLFSSTDRCTTLVSKEEVLLMLRERVSLNGRFVPATPSGPNGPETATHQGLETGDFYREPGSASAVKWLVHREGKTMRGWVVTDEGDKPSEKLYRLQPEKSGDFDCYIPVTTSEFYEMKKSLDYLQSICKGTDIDITVYGDGFNVFDCTTETQGTMSAEQLVRFAKLKKEYLRLTEDFS